MNKFIILVAIATYVAAEAPPHVGLTDFSSGGGDSDGGDGLNEYVDEALLARVADLISRGGDGSGTPQGSEGRQLDADILTRVSSSLSDGAGSASGPKPVYGAPPMASEPTELGEPEPAERIAEFDLTESVEQGGYSAPKEDAPAPVYGAPHHGGRPLGPPKNGRGPSSSGSGQITFGRPMAAQRLTDFSISGNAERDHSSGSHSSGYN